MLPPHAQKVSSGSLDSLGRSVPSGTKLKATWTEFGSGHLTKLNTVGQELGTLSSLDLT